MQNGGRLLSRCHQNGNITKDGAFWSRLEIDRAGAAIVYGSRLYAATDSGTLSILDIENGKEVGKQKLGTMMFGSPIFADGRIYTGEAAGRWYVMEPQGNKLKIVHRLRLEEEIIASRWSLMGEFILRPWEPFIASVSRTTNQSGNRFRSASRRSCLQGSEDCSHSGRSCRSPAQVWSQQKYEVRTYNKAGQFLKTVQVPLQLQGPGKVSPEGEFTAPTGSEHNRYDGDGGTGREEVDGAYSTIPPFPGRLIQRQKSPATWIGTAYRHQIREVNGEPMLVKVNTIPKGTRSQGWIGHPDSTTSHPSRFSGTRKNDQLPDMGLINQRYTLDLMGALQQLQIRSWTPRLELRFAKSVPHLWNEGVWYTLKFQSENQPGKAVLRGKVWPRGEPEPADWMIEAEDIAPNTVGSPGLFGNASVSEFFIDNVKVYDNPK